MNRELGPTRNVTATIKSKAQEEDGYKLELIVPAFKGQYPIAINRVPAEVAQKLITGKTYTLTLEQQSLRKKRDGSLYDGSQGWMYWWGLDDVPDQKLVKPESDITPPGEESRPAPDRQDLIMLQHATGVVAQAYGDWNRLLPGTRGKFADYLKAIAMGATWYLRNVYQKGGVSIQAPVPESTEEDDSDPPF